LHNRNEYEIISVNQRKKSKMKTREQIIDELELDESEIAILDNFSKYKDYITA